MRGKGKTIKPELHLSMYFNTENSLSEKQPSRVVPKQHRYMIGTRLWIHSFKTLVTEGSNKTDQVWDILCGSF